MKYKDPNKGIRPTKEETVDSDALTLEDGPVQEEEEKKLLKCNICGKKIHQQLDPGGTHGDTCETGEYV